jgi:hypothetical protein
MVRQMRKFGGEKKRFIEISSYPSTGDFRVHFLHAIGGYYLRRFPNYSNTQQQRRPYILD